MEKARKSSLLKMLCYILIPILVAILGFSIFHLAFLDEYGDIGEETEYTKSEQFANDYFYYITNTISRCENEKEGLIKYYGYIPSEGYCRQNSFYQTFTGGSYYIYIRNNGLSA